MRSLKDTAWKSYTTQVKQYIKYESSDYCRCHNISYDHVYEGRTKGVTIVVSCTNVYLLN